MGFTLNEVVYVINKIEGTITKNKQYLTDLDAAIGDGDHGINLSKGMRAASEKLKNATINDWSDIFKNVGMAIVSNVGGASGPLYGTAFMKAAALGKDKSTVTLQDFRDILVASIDGIKMRGKAELGDKTMLDSLIPALEEINYGIENNLSEINTLKNAVQAARDGVEKTKLIAARKGRASYLGDRSIGHQDPGATSSLMMLEVVYQVALELRG